MIFQKLQYGTPNIFQAPDTNPYAVSITQLFNNLVVGKHYKVIILGSNIALTPGAGSRKVILSKGTNDAYIPFKQTAPVSGQPAFEFAFVAIETQLKVEYQSNDVYNALDLITITCLLQETE